MRWANIIVLMVVVAAGAAAQRQTRQSSSAAMTFKMSSPAFTSGGAIPREYTCEGVDRAPSLEWNGVPAGTVTFALVMHDPDAPSGDWVHWIAWNIPATSHGMSENVLRQEQLADGTRQGRNSFGKIGYYGPCPPPGKAHRYFFRVYAIDSKLDLASGATRDQLQSALKGHVLAEAEYMGTYQR
jgi:Raf kinase inhibitor-like YbhB/YbcL family protein